MVSSNSDSPSFPSLIKKGKFYFLYEDSKDWVLEDKTKRGLEVKEKTNDQARNILSDKGIIYDMDGKGSKVNIRWFYPKDKFSLQIIEQDALMMEKRYLEIREITCPSD
jgi:hypothetical protein